MKKISLYFSLCIFIRLLLCYAVYKYYDSKFNIILIVIYTIFSIGFTYQYITKYRKKGAFSQNIWWDFLRPIHVVIYLIVVYNLIYKYKDTYKLLLLDTFIGILFHIYFNYLKY